MKKFIPLLLMLIAISGCDWMYEPVGPVGPSPLPPETSPVSHKHEVLDFYATWCGPCKLQAPRIKMLEHDGYNITPVDVDEDEAKAREYNIHSVPTYVVLIDGHEEYRIQNAFELADWLRDHDGSSIQRSESKVRHLPEASRQGRQNKSQGGRIITGEADGDGAARGETVETCLIRDRHLHKNDFGLRRTRDAG